MFAFRKFLVKYRLWIGLVLIGLGIYIGIESTWWIGWLPILIGLLTIVAHFLIGPVTLLQRYVESGDVEGAKELIDMVKFPNLLIKPIRSAFYMLKANFSTMNEDLDGAEAELKKSLASGVADKDYQGTAYLQLGTIANRKGNTKEAFEYLRKAVGVGLPDGDSNATAYLQLCSIAMQRRDFRGAKMYFSKAQSAKSKNPQILEQIAEVKKYIARIPG
jgi:tetratricopeptide (TPR) repeat protein